MQQQVRAVEDSWVQIYPVAVGGLHWGRKLRRMSQQPVECVANGNIEIPVRPAPEPDQMGGGGGMQIGVSVNVQAVIPANEASG